MTFEEELGTALAIAFKEVIEPEFIAPLKQRIKEQQERLVSLEFEIKAMKAKEYAASDAVPWRGPGKDKPRLLSIKGAA